MRFNRRTLLAAAAALPAAACVTPVRRDASRPLGLADITVRKELASDYAGTMRALAAIGYTHFGFRLAAMSPLEPAEIPAADKAAMVRDAGLGIDTVRLGYSAPFARQIEAAAKMGAAIVAYTAAPVFFATGTVGIATREAFDAWLPELGEIAAIARANGLRLAFHNHWWDHVPLGGESPIEIIARTYSPEQVGFEIDLAWAHIGGEDPLAFVRRLGPRVLAMHFKDVDPARGDDYGRQLVPPGEGVLGYAAMIPQLDRITNAIGYVEVDDPVDGLVAASNGYQTIAKAREG